jgi:hypothetical protein
MFPQDHYWPTIAPQLDSFKLDQILTELAKINKFMELISKAKEFDTLTNQPDCEDPEKLNLIKDLENRIAALEAQFNE